MIQKTHPSQGPLVDELAEITAICILQSDAKMVRREEDLFQLHDIRMQRAFPVVQQLASNDMLTGAPAPIQELNGHHFSRLNILRKLNKS